MLFFSDTFYALILCFVFMNFFSFGTSIIIKTYINENSFENVVKRAKHFVYINKMYFSLNAMEEEVVLLF
jgi:hypothetical protein